MPPWGSPTVDHDNVVFAMQGREGEDKLKWTPDLGHLEVDPEHDGGQSVGRDNQVQG